MSNSWFQVHWFYVPTVHPSPSNRGSGEAVENKSPKRPPGKGEKKVVDPRKLVEALTPIRETTFEDYEESGAGRDSQSEHIIKAMAIAHKEHKPKEEVWLQLNC